jgi:hypothetical protein
MKLYKLSKNYHPTKNTEDVCIEFHPKTGHVDLRTAQHVASRCADYAIPPHSNKLIKVTLWRVRVTTVAAQKQEVLHILSVCLYP